MYAALYRNKFHANSRTFFTYFDAFALTLILPLDSKPFNPWVDTLTFSMMSTRIHLVALFSLSTATSLLAANPVSAPDYHAWAATPPMGWNSWDCFGTTITEAQTRQQSDFMAKKLKQHGWRYIVVDIQWYQPTARGHDYQKDARLAMDEFSRLIPAPEKFPSADNGQGFKPLADSIHANGLKFGIHMMRGISRQAVRQNTPIKGTPYRASDIADTSNVCPWNPDMYGVDMSKAGAQAYYDSLIDLVASGSIKISNPSAGNLLPLCHLMERGCSA